MKKAQNNKSNWFGHVSEYGSFEEFRNAVITFLKKEKFSDIDGDSFNFFIHNDYVDSWQRVQIKAINKVFDRLYGDGMVRWGYIPYDDNSPCREELYWGPYIVINEKTFLWFFKGRYTLDSFVKRELKNAK